MVLFLLVSNYLLLRLGAPENADVVQFGLILAPLFILPFFYFLYELIGVHPLAVESMLSNFHLRGILALIMSTNIVFISMNSTHNIFSVLGHFIFAFIALLGFFYLCSLLRKATSVFSPPFRDDIDYLEPIILRYLASILECLYYFIVIYFIFMKAVWETILIIKADLWILCVSLALLLLATTAIVKLKFYRNGPFTLGFYEEKALPLSFFLFTITSILRFYF
jgi:hypothetical protein